MVGANRQMMRLRGQKRMLWTLHESMAEFLQRHSEQVAVFSTYLARAAKQDMAYVEDPQFDDWFVANIGACAYWHDIGKTGISNELWELPRALNKQEYALAKTHTILGAAMMCDKMALPDRKGAFVGRTKLDLVKDCCLYHHERWDGSGYPFGVKGVDIPLAGRIVAIADAYDCMTAVRPYSKAKTDAEALAEIGQCAGTQFDPVLARIFIAGMEGCVCPDSKQ